MPSAGLGERDSSSPRVSGRSPQEIAGISWEETALGKLIFISMSLVIWVQIWVC